MGSRINIYKVDKLLDKFVSKHMIYIFILILLFGFFLRTTYLDYDSMWIDETISAISAKSILDSGEPLLGSGHLYSRAELFHYVMSFFIYLFGGDFGARFISVVFGVLTIYLGYLFSKKFIDEPFSNVAFPLVLALSSIEIIYSKQARFYQAFQFFYFLSVYLFYSFVYLRYKDEYKKAIIYFILLAVSTYATIHLHSMGIILIPLFGAAFLILKFRFSHLKELRYIAIYFSFFVAALLSSIFILMRYDTLILADEYVKAMLYSNLYSNFMYSWLPILALSLIGLIVSLYDNFRKNLSLALFIIVPLFGLLLVKFFATRYSYFAIFLILFYLVYMLQRIHYRYLILILIIILYSGTMFSLSPIKEPRLDFSMPIADYKGAYQYIADNESLKDKEIITTWTPAAMWYGSGASYWINYSLDGRKNSWQIRDGVEVYSGATVIYQPEYFPDDSVLVLDSQGKRKIRPNMLQFINENCSLLNRSFNIEIFYCKTR
jgi:hypothetical protein